MKAPSEEIYTANQRKEHNIESTLYIHWVTTLSLTIRVYLHSFSRCCLPTSRNHAKFRQNLTLDSSRSSKVIDLGVNRKLPYEFLLVINSYFGRICYRFRDTDA